MNPTNDSSAAAFEAGLLQTLFSFHMETMNLLRNARLDDRQSGSAVERIGLLLDEIAAELKSGQSLDLNARLLVARDEVRRIVEESANSQDGDGDE